MKEKIKNKPIITAITVFLFVSIAMYLILDTSKNTFAVELPSDTKFDDINFYNCIREIKGKSDEDYIFTETELLDITYVECENRGIKSVKGIEYLTNLFYLRLEDNEIEEIDLTHNELLAQALLRNNKINSISINPISGGFIDVSDNQLESMNLGEHETLNGCTLTVFNNFIADRDTTCDGIGHCDFGYLVVFHSNGGTTIKTQNRKSKVLKPEDPTRAGYTFVDWFTDPEFTDGNEFDFNQTLTADIDLYAKWEETENIHTIEYSCGEEITCTGLPETTESKDTNVAIPEGTPSRENYDFEYWIIKDSDGTTCYSLTNPDCQNELPFEDDETNIVLEAVWRQLSYIIHYNCNGCTNSNIASAITMGAETPLTITDWIPTKLGYEFTYWTIIGRNEKYCNPARTDECISQVNFSSLGSNVREVTLVANWRELEQNNQTPTTYKLTYTCGGVTCSGLLGVPITSQSRTINITNIIPTRSDGKLFLHWIYKRNNGEIQKYCNPAKEECPSEITFPTGVTEITLEAVWEEDEPDDGNSYIPDNGPTKTTNSNQDTGLTNPGTGGITIALAVILVLLVIGTIYYSMKKTNK